jgi:hypothetical protein
MNQTESVSSAVKIRHLQMDHHRKQNVLQRTDVPLRSRLYGLEPQEVGTIWAESLTSYLNRLGWRHGVSPRALVAQEIALYVSNGEYLRTSSQLASFCRNGAGGINGMSESAVEWSSRLEQLTARSDLHSLTLRWWIAAPRAKKANHLLH